jgi:hypothetical protein
MEPDQLVTAVLCRATGKPARQGVYVSLRLSFGSVGKACEGNAKVANRTREIRPYGMKREACGNVDLGWN